MGLLDTWRARRAAGARGPYGLIVAGVLVALAAALAVLPARWLMRLVDDDGLFAIVDASGTIWNGTALLALGPAGARRTLPQPVSWQWTWHGVMLAHPWLGSTVRLAPAWRGLATPTFSVSAGTMRLPAEILSAFGSPVNTLAPGGNLEVRWPDYDAGVARGPELLQVQWSDATSALSIVRPLGSYRLQAMQGKGGGKGNDVQVMLTTLNGPLKVQASGVWNGRRLTLNGTAEPDAAAPDTTRAGLETLLSAIGRRNGPQSLFGTGK
ncbi:MULTISPECIES: type II secretion system protein N [unclassified Achromobacter]|uniref:type II secretion system protein N n=1 Tax=unclassified Achromobacter TaxID=2626865 RepID=UPI000B515E0B|nr:MULTISPECIES: type II secretion system protein N [unclassified Achromobacter]OWT70188.1 general secretion pathway protein GspN [Achromobacter sp. HZ34]OWT71728.1 general secretion pathway protein GspN [Achromobacter sp. HZ28]